MNILVDIGHPGHVHLFRIPIQNWSEHGHNVVVSIRERDIVGQLLKAYDIPYHVASTARYVWRDSFTNCSNMTGRCCAWRGSTRVTCCWGLR